MRANFHKGYYLYSISHPSKSGEPHYDLSDVTSLNTTLKGKQLAVERVIIKVFRKLHCNVCITDTLRQLFAAKLCRMGSAFRSQGSRGQANLQENWKRTDWIVELADDETVSRNSYQQSQSMLSKLVLW